MIEIYLLTIFLIIFLLVLNTNSVLKKKKQKVKKIAVTVQLPRSLLENLASHRGMVNAYLKGDHTFKPKNSKLQFLIDDSFKHLITNEDATNYDTNNVKLMSHQWETLKTDAMSRQPADSFQLHVLIIGDIIENLAEKSLIIEMALSETPNAKAITYTLLSELPHYIEILGQARGIGTGAIAQGGCSVDVKMNLKYLYDELDSMIESLNKLKHIDTQRLSNNLDMNGLVINNIAAIQVFSHTLKNNLIELKSPEISTEKLYNLGTEAIAHSLKMFDTLYPLCLARINIKLE